MAMEKEGKEANLQGEAKEAANAGIAAANALFGR